MPSFEARGRGQIHTAVFFFGESLSWQLGDEGPKTELAQFQHDQLREAYHPIPLMEMGGGVSQDYGPCAESIPLLCNVSM